MGVNTFAVEFDIERNVFKRLLEFSVSIYNLSETVLSSLTRYYSNRNAETLTRDKIKVQVGRSPQVDNTWSNLVEGEIYYVSSQKEGGDVITNFSCSNFSQAFQKRNINKTYNGGTYVPNALNDLSPNYIIVDERLNSSVLAKNYVFTETAQKAVNTIAKDEGLIFENTRTFKQRVSFADYIPNKPPRTNIFELSKSSGLVSYPIRNGGSFYEVESLFNPLLEIGEWVNIKTVTGYFKEAKDCLITKIAHSWQDTSASTSLTVDPEGRGRDVVTVGGLR